MTTRQLIALAFAFSACAGRDNGLRSTIACTRSDGLADHQPAVARQWTYGEHLSEDEPLGLRVVMPLADREALEAHLAAMSDPTHPGFGQVLSPAQFKARHLSGQAQTEAMRAHLAAAGFEVVPQASGMILAAHGLVRHAHAAFGVTPRRLVGRDAFAPTERPSLPADLPALAVRGLSSTARYRSYATQRPLAEGAELTAETLRRAYQVPDSARGAGQTIAVVALDGVRPSDVSTYCRQNNLREVPRRVVTFGRATGKVVTATGASEMAMDVELINAMAPDAREIVLLTARADDPHAMSDILAWLVEHAGDPNQPIRHVSCSWGAPESQLSEASVRAEGQMFAALAAMGVTFWSASGDSGAMDDGSSLGVDDPASQAWVAGVGGTSLELTASGDYKNETTWPGTGGGESCFWPAPPWQAAVVGKARQVPDVALAADPARGHHLIVDGKWVVMGGTSAAAPAWAAFAALVEGERERAGKPPVGFWPAQLYPLMAKNPAPLMHDIADEGSNGFYTSKAGRDDCTGFGSFIGTALLPAMVALDIPVAR